jgi:hypothetical protein
MQYRNPSNRQLVLEALQKANRMDLVGSGPKCLIYVDDKKQGKRFGNRPTNGKPTGGKATGNKPAGAKGSFGKAGNNKPFDKFDKKTSGKNTTRKHK